jgi:hypothetical protein
MARRWWIPLMALPVVAGVGSLLAVGVASASPGLAHPAKQPAAAHAVSPGSPMIWPSGVAVRSGPNVRNVTVSSNNWSGYALSRGNGAFRSVSASWIQPRAQCAGVAGHRYAAFWVGLDGFSSHSVEQTGTDTDCRGRTPTYYGWYEMFPAAPVFFRTKVNPGDHISASVTFSGTRTYTLVLRDITRGWVHTIIKNQAGLSRSSAEVIVEAPSSTGGVLPLANFGTIRITGSRANGVLLRRLAPIRIQMVNGAGRLKDTTSLIGPADAFTDRWIRSF